MLKICSKLSSMSTVFKDSGYLTILLSAPDHIIKNIMVKIKLNYSFITVSKKMVKLLDSLLQNLSSAFNRSCLACSKVIEIIVYPQEVSRIALATAFFGSL